MLTVLLFVVPLISALRISVTRRQCGNTYDILKEQEIYLAYENFVLELFEDCEIKITNDDLDKMICIKNEGPYLDVDCGMHLQYHVGRKKAFFDTDSACTTFMSRPRCDRVSEAFVVYRNFHNKKANVHVKLYTKKYVEPTTRKPWSSWSSWSSSYDNDSYNDDDDDGGLNGGTVIGIVIGIIATIVLIISCAFSNGSKRTVHEPQYAPSVQYTPQSGNQSLQQSQNNTNQRAGARQFPPNQAGLQEPQQYTSDPPDYSGYHVHHPVFQQVPDQDSSAGQQSTGQTEAPAPNYEDPPPPYPGY